MFSPASPGVVYRPGTVGFEHPLSNVFFLAAVLSSLPFSLSVALLGTCVRGGKLLCWKYHCPTTTDAAAAAAVTTPVSAAAPATATGFPFSFFPFFSFFFLLSLPFSPSHTHHPECPAIKRQDKGERSGDEGHGRTLCRDPVLHSPRRRGRHKKRVPPGAPRAVQGVAEAHHRAPRSLHRRLPPG